MTQDIRHIEINASSSASTVKLAKTKAITHLLTYATAFLGRHFLCHEATQKLGNSNVLYSKRKIPVENLVKHQVPIGSFIRCKLNLRRQGNI